ncbi:MAG: DUF2059 domain-containing protein [Oxalicibacterium faecigallinarum]|uniref:DUF2059 domain-containing protein n=1 Tax=Oxalicibacterium faecigallinarum TaxID=573741 RepID=UPI0028097273|nr:DUF2059 domain-containing protein [Oxalicibacterium faecigallinarum]MDQ7969133.1 DUF2059 domain-containing protein [Oxalicibacterium faecigallinarum]
MKSLITLLLALTVSGAALAEKPSAESIEKLLIVTDSDKVMDQMFDHLDGFMKNMVNQSVQQNKMNEEGRKVMDNFMARMVKVMREELSWEQTKPIYVQVYSENFTQQEVDDLLTFYATPTGKALIEKMPVVMGKSMELTQARIGPMMQRMQREMRAAVAEVKAAQKADGAQ